MDMDNEVLKALSESNKLFDEFKGKVFSRLDQLETKEAKARRPWLGSSEHLDSDQREGLRALKSYMRSGDYSDLKALGTTGGPDGGFAVPKVIDGMIEDVAVNISPIRQIAQVVQISTQDYHKLVNMRGATTGWVGETEARPSTSTSQFADIAPPMGEIYANIPATQVMLDDVFFNAEQWIATEAGTVFARDEGAAFVNGTGVKQPKGFLNYTKAATADGSRDFGTLEYVATGVSGDFKTLTSTVNPVDDLFTLVSKMKREYRNDAVWVMNKATLFRVMGMKDYQGRFVFSPAMAPNMQDTLLGFPIYEAEDMPDVAANSYSIAFGNFKRGYLIVDRVGTRILRDPFSNKPYVMFYVTKRLGGGLLNSECIKLLKFGTS